MGCLIFSSPLDFYQQRSFSLKNLFIEPSYYNWLCWVPGCRPCASGGPCARCASRSRSCSCWRPRRRWWHRYTLGYNTQRKQLLWPSLLWRCLIYLQYSLHHFLDPIQSVFLGEVLHDGWDVLCGELFIFQLAQKTCFPHRPIADYNYKYSLIKSVHCCKNPW